MSKDTINVNMNIYDIPIVVEQLNKLEQENTRLQNNWNELKEHCNTMLSIFEKMSDKQRQEQLDRYVIYDKFLSKIQELENRKA